jgi:uncharacterized protein YeaO (DUF488 family)
MTRSSSPYGCTDLCSRAKICPFERGILAPDNPHGGVPMAKAILLGNVKLKRAYEAPAVEDGTRILVDRLWPRGIKKADAAIDLWMKDVAPSTGLRQWFGHETDRWQEFRRRYVDELRQKSDLVDELRALARKGPITLVFAAHDQTHNDAVVLREILLDESLNSTVS